jgi:hypothetical protein
MAEERRQEFLRADRPFVWRDEHRTEIAKHLVDQLMAGGVKPRRLIAVVWGNEYVRDPAKPAGFFFRRKQGTWNEVQKSDHFEGPLAYKVSSEQFVGVDGVILSAATEGPSSRTAPWELALGPRRTDAYYVGSRPHPVSNVSREWFDRAVEGLKKLGELNELLLSELLPPDLNYDDL